MELRQQWIDAIGANNITSDESRICSSHFKGGRKSDWNPVPTIFPDTTNLDANTSQVCANIIQKYLFSPKWSYIHRLDRSSYQTGYRYYWVLSCSIHVLHVHRTPPPIWLLLSHKLEEFPFCINCDCSMISVTEGFYGFDQNSSIKFWNGITQAIMI